VPVGSCTVDSLVYRIDDCGGSGGDLGDGSVASVYTNSDYYTLAY